MSNIILEDITSEFAYCQYFDFRVIAKKSNGYINATKMCQLISNRFGINKTYGQWERHAESKDIIASFSKKLNCSESDLIQVVTCGGNIIIRGTYVHPILLTHIAIWISPEFGVNVCIFVEEWRRNNELNNKIYYDKLSSSCRPCGPHNFLPEKEVQQEIHKELGGDIDVETGVGMIDILTHDKIIKVKNIKGWKNALGNLLIHAVFYPTHNKYIYLFGNSIGYNKQMITECYRMNHVSVIFYKC